MKVSEALRGVVLLGIDTAPLIYLVEKHPRYFDCMVFILKHITSGPMSAVSSMMTLTEVLTQPLRLKNMALVEEYEDILQNSTGFKLVALDARIARKAADLRSQHNLKTPDAIQIATCMVMGCHAFLTNDLGLKRVTDLPILILDELEFDSSAERSLDSE